MDKKVQIMIPQGMLGRFDGESILVSGLREIALKYSRDYEKEWPEKYGTDYEDDKFIMHRFCWCDQEDCAWCGNVHFPNFLYKPTNFKVWWYKYIGRSMKTEPNLDNGELIKILNELL